MPTNLPVRKIFANESDRLDRKGRGWGKSLGKTFSNFKKSLLAAKAAAEDRTDAVYSFLVGAVDVSIKAGKYMAQKAFAMNAREEAALNGDKPKPGRPRAGLRFTPA